MQRQIVVEGVSQIVDAGIAAAPDVLRGDLGKGPFDLVQPWCAGGRKGQLEARVLLQPGLHVGRLVGGVDVEDQPPSHFPSTARSCRV